MDHVVTCARPAARSPQDGSTFCEHCGTPVWAPRRRSRSPCSPSPERAGGTPVCRGLRRHRSPPTGTARTAASPRSASATTGASCRPPLVGGVCDRGRRKSRNEDAMALAVRRRPPPSSWCATGCPTSRTPTSRASPRRAPRGTSWSPASTAAASRRGLVGALLVDAPRRPTRPSPTPSATRPTAPSRRRARSSRPSSTARPSSPAGWATPACTGCPDAGDAHQLSVGRLGRERDDRARHAAGQGGGVARGARHHALARSRRARPSSRSTAHDARAGARLGARLLGRPVELLLRGRRRRRPARTAPWRRSAAARRDLAASSSRWANEQGGHDNITVALARVAARRRYCPDRRDGVGPSPPTARSR